MASSILSLVLSFQLLFSSGETASPQAFTPQALVSHPQENLHVSRLWWGLIDPELSAWFARLPFAEEDPDAPILWDWSWRGFLASLFDIRMTKEAAIHAPSV